MKLHTLTLVVVMVIGIALAVTNAGSLVPQWAWAVGGIVVGLIALGTRHVGRTRREPDSTSAHTLGIGDQSR